MTTFQLTLMLLNTFCAGATVAVAVIQMIDGRTAKLPLTLAAINFAAVGIALI